MPYLVNIVMLYMIMNHATKISLLIQMPADLIGTEATAECPMCQNHENSRYEGKEWGKKKAPVLPKMYNLVT